jgi:hypothetical protein
MSITQQMELAKQQCMPTSIPATNPPPTFTSPFMKEDLLHPGSPPQGLVTPPQNHANIAEDRNIHGSQHGSPQLQFSDPFSNMVPKHSMYRMSESNHRAAPYRRQSVDRPLNGGKGFRRAEHLKRHIRSQSGENLYTGYVPQRSMSRPDHYQQNNPAFEMQMSQIQANWDAHSVHSMDQSYQSLLPTDLDFDVSGSPFMDRTTTPMLELESHRGSHYLSQPAYYPTMMNGGSSLKEEVGNQHELKDHMDNLMGDLLSLDPDLQTTILSTY